MFDPIPQCFRAARRVLHITAMTDIIKSFRELIVWQKSMDLAVRAYKTAKKLPAEDRVALGHQIRKSSVSMPSRFTVPASRLDQP
jgi:23S rRNA-intervening sequence protein